MKWYGWRWLKGGRKVYDFWYDAPSKQPLNGSDKQS